jgi:hypothetical protein
MAVPTVVLAVVKKFFFIMYFSLPDSIPPRPLGGARVRKHWVASIVRQLQSLNTENYYHVCFIYKHKVLSSDERLSRMSF